MIRLANQKDIHAIHSIYAWYVWHSTATFAYQVPDIDDMQKQMQEIQQTYPYYVYVEQDQVLGYAYAHRYKEKEAYGWDVEITIYVDHNQRAKHIGSQLMEVLLTALKQQNIIHAYSCITIPNDASIALHKRFGFEMIAIFKRSGYKNEQWLDVCWMDKCLQESFDKPKPIINISNIKK